MSKYNDNDRMGIIRAMLVVVFYKMLVRKRKIK